MSIFSKITSIPLKLPISIFNGGTNATTAQLARINLGMKCDLLWGNADGTSWGTSVDLPLAHPFTDYDILIFVYSHLNESLQNPSNSYIHSTCYPTAFLKNVMDKGGFIATFNYSTRFARYSIANTSLIKWSRNGDSGTTGMIAVYGMKCS